MILEIFSRMDFINENFIGHHPEDGNESLRMLFAPNGQASFSNALHINNFIYTLKAGALPVLFIRLLCKKDELLAKDQASYFRAIFCLLHRLTSEASCLLRPDILSLLKPLSMLLELPTVNSQFFDILTQSVIFIEKLHKHHRDILLLNATDPFFVNFCCTILQISPPYYKIFHARSLLKILSFTGSGLGHNFPFDEDIMARIKQQLENSRGTLLLSISGPFLFTFHDNFPNGLILDLVLDLHMLLLHMKNSPFLCEQIVKESYALESISPASNSLLEAFSAIDDYLLMVYLELFIGRINVIQIHLPSDLIVYISFLDFIEFDVTLVIDWISSGQVALISLMLAFTKRFILGLHDRHSCEDAEGLVDVISFHSKITHSIRTIINANPKAFSFNVQPLLDKFESLKSKLTNKTLILFCRLDKCIFAFYKFPSDRRPFVFHIGFQLIGGNMDVDVLQKIGIWIHRC